MHLIFCDHVSAGADCVPFTIPGVVLPSTPPPPPSLLINRQSYNESRLLVYQTRSLRIRSLRCLHRHFPSLGYKHRNLINEIVIDPLFSEALVRAMPRMLSSCGSYISYLLSPFYHQVRIVEYGTIAPDPRLPNSVSAKFTVEVSDPKIIRKS